jgi:hypothetical protein
MGGSLASRKESCYFLKCRIWKRALWIWWGVGEVDLMSIMRLVGAVRHRAERTLVSVQC